MPNNNPMIFLPGGQGAIRRAEVVSLTTREMATLRDFHAIAQRYNLGLHCAECKDDLRGDNTGHESVFTVRCSCREFKGERPRDV